MLTQVFKQNIAVIQFFVFLISGISMLVPVLHFTFWSLFLSFLVLEGMVGMFNCCGAILRSQFYPESSQSSIMSVFRLLLNIVVVVGTKLANNAESVVALQFVFKIVALMHVSAAILQVFLIFNSSSKSVISNLKVD
jgi:hypothetical protein